MAAPDRRRPGTERRRRAALRFVACVLVAACGPADEGQLITTDLSPDLITGEVCEVGGGRCEHDERARRRHGVQIPGPGAVITLPVGTESALYRRVPASARIAFQFVARGATLTVTARAAGESARALFGGTSAEWQHAEVELPLAAGTIARLAFVATPAPGAGVVLVRDVTLHERAPVAPPPAPPPATRPNVVLFVIDTLRADHLGCFGATAAASPAIDAFAATAVRYPAMVAQSSWTRTSTASIFTGVVPDRHGAFEPGDAIDPRAATLPELLQAAGYATEALVVNPVVAPPFGFERGFDRFRLFSTRPSRLDLFLGSDRVARRASATVRRLAEPFFLYVHVADPHAPYVGRRRLRPGRDDLDRAAASQRRCPNCLRDLRHRRPVSLPPREIVELRALYAQDVRMADTGFGVVMEALARQGLRDRTLVVLTSDHGEEFGEHGGMTHGQTLYREMTAVPLVIRYPDGHGAGSVDARLVQHVDILPTVLAEAGIVPPADVDGIAIRRGDASAWVGREAESHLVLEGNEVRALADGRWQFIQFPDRPLEIFDGTAKPGEERNLAGRDPALDGYAAARLGSMAPARRVRPEVTGAPIEQLRALGYL